MPTSEENKENSKKISIIIPCYNCENTIDYCLDAIFAQTIGINNLEIILVNDASTDNTLTKLCEYEKLYPDSILVINCTENGRQGTARNIALSYASGEYVAYVDDDDVMERNMYELLYQAAQQTNAEVIVSTNQTVPILPSCLNSPRNNTLLLKDTLEIQTIEDRRKLLDSNSINNAVWNKLYQKQFLIDNEIHFAEHIIYEDILFTTLMKIYVSKICILENIFYYHILTNASSSLNESFNNQRIFDYLGVHAETIEKLRMRNKSTPYESILLTWYIQAYLTCALYHVELNKHIDTDYLTIIDDSVEQLFPGKVSRKALHDLLLQELKNSEKKK